jgi:dTMP kinase
MSPTKCLVMPPPGVELSRLTGQLVVIEGPDASGRSTQIVRLSRWIEEQGCSVVQVGLKRSVLVGGALEKAKQGNVLSPRTMSLFYAADFYDQLENIIVPALSAGSVVIADRYIFTLIARDLARGADQKWVESLYSRALTPDAVFFLKVSPEQLALRTLKSRQKLDYWESGMDMSLSRDWFDCFDKYQRLMNQVFESLKKKYGFDVIDADKPIDAVQKELRNRIVVLLKKDLGVFSENL